MESKKITITNAAYQSKIDELEKALTCLKGAITILEAQKPTKEERSDNEAFAESLDEAFDMCSHSIYHLSSAISDLVRAELINFYQY